jgi:hypothetical protein
MRSLKWLTILGIAVVLSWAGRQSVGQTAPASPTYVDIERTIQSVRQGWEQPGTRPEPNSDGWISLFNALTENLQSYGTATNDADRLNALDRISAFSTALGMVAWSPAATLREELNQWLQPRLRLARARQQLSETVTSLPPASEPSAQANRHRWVEFVQNDLGGALRDYDAATTVQQRQAALKRLHEALASLDRQNQGQQSQGRPWPLSWELEAAMNDLFNRPNLDIAADVATVAPVFEANLVQTGPVTRKGYTSMVTAGPKTGFGLIPLDGGIGFYNSQSLVSVTPIHDFQQQIEQDPQGQRAAKLYYFSATTYDWSNLTVTAVITPEGLNLSPSSTHAIDASIGSAPTAGRNLGRGIAALIGMDQGAITERVREGALPKFQQQIPQEAQEEALERISVEQAQRNADLRSKYLVGNDTAAVRDFLIRQLSLQSRPHAVFIGGRFEWRGMPDQRGADSPQPPKLAATIDSGVTADLHLGSLLTSAASGLWQQDQLRSVQNLMIQTKAVPPGTPPKDAVGVSKNVAFADYVKAVDAARNAHDPRVQALRIERPKEAPEFSTDARGFLVALVRDFQIDVPAPDPQAGGNLLGVPAKILRLKAPLVEIALSYEPDTSTPGSLRLKGKIQEFNPGTTGEVIAINDDENQGKPLTRFQSAIVMSALGMKIRSQAIDVSLDQLKLPGFKIQSVSSLEPSGWARVNLVRAEGTPLQNTQAVQDVTPPPVHGPGQPVGTTPTVSITPPASAGPVANAVPVVAAPNR